MQSRQSTDSRDRHNKNALGYAKIARLKSQMILEVQDSY
jgi:hypothetical protein